MLALHPYQRSLAVFFFLLFFGLVVFGALLWVNLWFIQHYPAGQQFMQLYKPAVAFLKEGFGPYSREALTRVQVGVYGREALPTEFAYALDVPFHLFVLFLPFGLIQDADLALAIWMLFIEIVVLLLPWYILKTAEIEVSRRAFLIIMLAFVFYAPVFFSLLQGSLAPLAFFALIAALQAIQRESDELAGALLALSFLRVEWLGIFSVILFLWAITQKRWRVLVGFAMALILLNILAFIFLPAWVLDFLRAVLRNWISFSFESTFSILSAAFPAIGGRLALFLLAGMGGVLIWEWTNIREQGLRQLFWFMSLSAAALPLLGLPIGQNSLMAFAPGLMFGLILITERWQTYGLIFSMICSIGIVAWSWAATVTSQPISALALPLSVFTLLVLYWIRWWINQPRKFWADIISEQ